MMVVGSQNTSTTRLGGHLRDEEMNMKRFPSVQIGLVMFSIKAGDKKLESHDYVHHFDPLDDWHIYEMVWHPDFIAWSIDGHEVRRIHGEEAGVAL